MSLAMRLAGRMRLFARGYTPDPRQGLRFAPDGKGGETLYRWGKVQRPGFRPCPGWVVVRRVVPYGAVRAAA